MSGLRRPAPPRQIATRVPRAVRQIATYSRSFKKRMSRGAMKPE